MKDTLLVDASVTGTAPLQSPALLFPALPSPARATLACMSTWVTAAQLPLGVTAASGKQLHAAPCGAAV